MKEDTIDAQDVSVAKKYSEGGIQKRNQLRGILEEKILRLKSLICQKKEEDDIFISISEENDEEAAQIQKGKNDAINKIRLQRIKVSKRLSSNVYVSN